MGHLLVRGNEVDQLARRVGASADRMATAAQALRHADSSRLGTDDLESACAEFADTWDYGIEQLGKCTGEAVEFLQTATRVFTDADMRLGEVITDAVQSSGGSGGSR